MFGEFGVLLSRAWRRLARSSNAAPAAVLFVLWPHLGLSCVNKKRAAPTIQTLSKGWEMDAKKLVILEGESKAIDEPREILPGRWAAFNASPSKSSTTARKVR